MTVIYSRDGEVVRNEAVIAGAPAVRITGLNVQLINTGLGRIRSDTAGSPAISIEASGAVIVNEVDGVIASEPGTVAISGSAAADTIVNAGTIQGIVSLVGGSDRFTERGAYSPVIDFGAGNDIYRHEGVHSWAAPQVSGGAGTDTLYLLGDFGVVDGDAATGFENLVVGQAVGNIQNFSAFQKITIESAGSAEVDFVNFLNSVNPNVDLALSGQFLIVNVGSSFRNITGSARGEGVEIGGSVLGNIALGDGDDGLSLRWDYSNAAFIAGTIDGGAGTNTVSLNTEDGRTIDLTTFQNFTVARTGTLTGDTASVRLVNGNNYVRFESDGGGLLTLANTYAPTANLTIGPFHSSATLEASATIGSVGSYYEELELIDSPYEPFSVYLRNDGKILGNVWLNVGDDVYDGRAGVTGGTVFGFSGNDHIMGGAGAELLVGGFGADRLEGGGGNDRLQGGPGSDILVGGRGTDTALFAGSHAGYELTNAGGGQARIVGPDGADRVIEVERLQFADAKYAVPAALFANQSGLATQSFGASTAAGGWSSAETYPRTLGDINGDGLADIVGFGSAGVYAALATGNGGFGNMYLATRAFGASAKAGGWTDADTFPRTLADINGDGAADIVGFGSAGVYAALADGNGGFGAMVLATKAFGTSPAAGGWTDADTYPRTLADINGDGRADLVGFGSAGVYAALANGSGGFGNMFLATKAFGTSTEAGGWTDAGTYPRLLADINGDGLADLIGFGSAGVYTALATGGGKFATMKLAVNGFGAGPDGGNWSSQDLFPRDAADVNGDGNADLIGFGELGVYVATSNGDGTFGQPVFDLAGFGAGASGGGWTSNDLFPRELADVTGDGLADIIGFGNAGVHLAVATDLVLI